MKLHISAAVNHKWLFVLGLFLFFNAAQAQKAASPSREYIQIKIYHAVDSSSLATISGYLQSALLPALQKSGFTRTGFFTVIDNDTAKDKRIYVITPLSSLAQLEKLTETLDRTAGDSLLSPTYTKAAYNTPVFNRVETVLLHAFEGAPQVKASGLKGEKADRVYELRSYESATEALHQNKVRMFNSGEEDLFQRLGFNAVFYGQVVAGSAMPNLMYMTSFDDKAARDEHWKAFGGDPEWKTLSAKPEFQHNVSKITIVFLRPMSYSRL